MFGEVVESEVGLKKSVNPGTSSARREQQVGALLLVGVLFLLIGVGVLIAGAVAAVKQSRQSGSRVAGTGKVVDLVKRVFNAGSGGVYCPVGEFTAMGQLVRFESEFGTMPATHQVGQSIAVRYEPADPQKAEVDSATSRWLVPGCMIGMGVLFLGMGLVFVAIGILVLANQ